MLMTQPQIGSHHPEVGKDIRLLVHGKYLIFYRVRSDYVRIERILHGARYLPEAFKKYADWPCGLRST